jgi:hypothetical protein
LTTPNRHGYPSIGAVERPEQKAMGKAVKNIFEEL